MTQYDACWLAPQSVLILSDPVTTVADTDPRTCGSLAPVQDDVSAGKCSPAAVISPPEFGQVAGRAERLWAQQPIPQSSTSMDILSPQTDASDGSATVDILSPCSCHTICKEYLDV